MDLETIARLLGGFLLLLGNAFFVTTEFALTRVRQFDEGEFQDHPGLRRAWKMTDEMEIYLSGCQVGITIMSVGLGVVAEPAVTRIFVPVGELFGGGELSRHAVAVTLSLVVINLLHVIIGEQGPTYLGVERTKTINRLLAPLLYWWTCLMYPVIWLADRATKGLLALFGVRITRSWKKVEGEAGEAEESEPSPPRDRAEIRRRMGEILSHGGIPSDRRREVLRALEIGEIPVRDVMVDREEIVALWTSAPLEENLETLRRHAYVRLPLVGETLEDVRGTIYTPSLFRCFQELCSGELELEAVAEEPLRMEADLPVSVAIDRFQEHRQELALVFEDEKVVGLLTSTNAFEAIAGELQDPHDTA